MRALPSIELFGGCGGLGLGLARAGFRSRVFVEWNADAVATVRFNAQAGVEHLRDWHVSHSDVRLLKWGDLREGLALVSGGPPCQPFGIGGLKRGAEDNRDMWPEAIRTVRETRPAAFLFENVRNLAGPRFRPYLNWIEHRLRHVEAEYAPMVETPADQIVRLNRTKVDYRTLTTVVNAADYGAPQIRYRILVAGVRADLGVDLCHPRPTHSLESLLWDQWVTGNYWRRHHLAIPDDDTIPPRMLRSVSRLRSQMIAPALEAWRTVRDAIGDLGPPDGTNSHSFQAGAKVYAGHTGSPLDMPAKALKAGDHGVPGGENMAILDDGSVRYFTLRESARLVGLPDNYRFCRSWTETMRCLGNAVPTQLGESAGSWIRGTLEAADAAKSHTRKRAA